MIGRASLDSLVFDGAAGQVVAGELERAVGDVALQGRVLEALLASRAEFDGELGGSTARVALDVLSASSGERVLIARGEVLVEGGEGAEVLAEAGFTRGGELGAGPRVSRWRRLGAGADEVRAVVSSLRSRGVVAGPNYVVTCHPMVKRLGAGAPVPTPRQPRPRREARDAGAGVSVAVLDTGVDAQAMTAGHGWLSGITAAHDGLDVLDTVPVPDGYLDDGAGHGTFVAGVLRQVAPCVQVEMVRVVASDGLGTEFSVAEALFALTARAVAPQLVNLSLGCRTVDHVAPVALRAAVDGLVVAHPDTLLIAAAGNDGTTEASWPAAHPAVIAVGAAQGTVPAAYSNRGGWVDFYVEVDGIVSTYVHGVRRSADDQRVYHGDYAAWAGTSFAAPVVTGLLVARLAAGMTTHQAITALHTSTTSRHATVA